MNLDNSISSIKHSILLSITTLFAASVSASHGQGSSLTSVNGLMSTFGLEPGNMFHNLSIAATLGLLWLSVYMILKKVVVKFELQDLFNLESGGVNQDSDKKNLVAVLALLIVISMMGAGHWIEPIGLIWDIQQLLLLALAFGIIALLLAVLGGGTAGVAWTAGQTGHALNQGMQEIEQARQDLGNIGNNNGNGGNGGGNPSDQADDLEDAVDEIENGFNDIETPLHHIEQDIVDDVQKINDAINDPQSARGNDVEYRKLEDKIKHFKKGLELMRSQVHAGGFTQSEIKNGTGNFQYSSSRVASLNLPDKYQKFGLIQAKNEINEIKESAKRLDTKEEHAVSVLDDELNSLIKDSKNMAKSASALKKMLKELKTVQDKDKMIKNAAEELDDRSLFDQARTIGQHEQYLENKLDPILNNELPNIKNKLETSRRRLEKDLSMSESTVNSLQGILDGGDIQNELNSIESEVGNQLGGVPSDVSNALDHIRSDTQEAWNYLRAMYQADRHEIDDEEKIIKRIDEAIDAIDEVLNT